MGRPSNVFLLRPNLKQGQKSLNKQDRQLLTNLSTLKTALLKVGLEENRFTEARVDLEGSLLRCEIRDLRWENGEEVYELFYNNVKIAEAYVDVSSNQQCVMYYKNINLNILSQKLVSQYEQYKANLNINTFKDNAISLINILNNKLQAENIHQKNSTFNNDPIYKDVYDFITLLLNDLLNMESNDQESTFAYHFMKQLETLENNNRAKTRMISSAFEKVETELLDKNKWQEKGVGFLSCKEAGGIIHARTLLNNMDAVFAFLANKLTISNKNRHKDVHQLYQFCAICDGVLHADNSILVADPRRRLDNPVQVYNRTSR